MDSGLTSWAASEDQLTDFIIDKDEQGVGEGAEPPVGPGKHKHTRKKKKRRDEKGIQCPGHGVGMTHDKCTTCNTKTLSDYLKIMRIVVVLQSFFSDTFEFPIIY